LLQGQDFGYDFVRSLRGTPLDPVSLVGYPLFHWPNSINGEPINGEGFSAEIQTPR
jgi:hypothetical protein